MDDSGQRRRGIPLGIVFLIVLVIGHAQTEDVCRTGCKGASKVFKYATGTTYKYNYDGKIAISLTSAKGQSTSTEVKAEVLLTQAGDCNQIIKLQNVQILGSNGKKVGAIPDIEKPIRINFNDGEISDSICVVDGDNQNSINIKRAIASLFQSSSKSGYETDVFGRCPTEIASHKEGQSLVVKKARSLNKCGFRENIQQAFLATAFNLDSQIKSSPLLNGDYRAVLKIKNGILEQATVTEEYAFIPFSVGENGAKAEVTSTLKYVGTSKINGQVAVTQPRSIIFENPHPVVSPTVNVQTVINAVKEVVKSVDNVVSKNTAREFVNLLKVVRVSKTVDLLAVYNQIKSGVVGEVQVAQRVLLDALLESGNGESIQALLELLKRNELSETDSKLTLLGLSAARHATEGSLTAAVQLLDNPKFPRETYLGVGSLAGLFCRQYSCEKNAAAKTLLDKIVSKISNKANNRQQEDEIIYALKALGNVGYLNDNLLTKLINIAQNKNLSNRLRIAALDAYLANPCKPKLRDSALSVLQDIQQDSEIRIKAYLVVAQCPNAKAGNTIKTLIEKEPSVQVGGFIYSHLRTIQTSTNPDKQAAKQFLNFVPKKRFAYDPRRYSFNEEFSYAADTFGIAASNEANVIYSQNSWLPRSTSLNLTAQLFGHTFNFLEIDTRQENLDKLVEHYLGPKGVLRSKTNKEWAKGFEEYKKIKEYVQKKLDAELARSKRDVSKAELETIGKQTQIKTNELNKDLDLDLTIKAFGSELLFLNLNQEAAMLTPEAIVDKLFEQFSNGLDKLKNFQDIFRRNILFLDTEIDYPTSLGFPLRLAAEGSASLQVQAQGGLDIRKLINNPLSGQANLKLVPSASIEVSGRLTLDALTVETGLKVVSTLHTATGGDASLSWDNTGGFEFKFGLPVQEQKLISAQHEIVFVSREQTGSEQNLPLKFEQAKDFSICIDQLSPFIGLSLCLELNSPNVENPDTPTIGFPLAGDATLAVTIENDDLSAFVVKHTVEKRGHAEFLLETIGKNNARKASLNLIAEYSPEIYLRGVLNSAPKNVEAELRCIGTKVEKSLSLKFIEDQNVYNGKLGIRVSGSAQRTVFEPIIEFKTPRGHQVLPLQVGGRIIIEENQQDVKYTFDHLKFAVDNGQFSINGNAGIQGSQSIYTDVTLSDGKDSVSITGKLSYVVDTFNGNVKIQNTINPKANVHLTVEVKNKPNEITNSIVLVHGPDLNTKTSVLSITGAVTHKFTDHKNYEYALKQSITYPLVALSLKFEIENKPKSGDIKFSAQYGDVKFGTELELEIDKKSPGDYDLEFDLWGLGNKLELECTRVVQGEEESTISNKLEINGKKFGVDGKIRHVIRPRHFDVGSDLTVTVDGHPAPFKISNGLIINQGSTEFHQKLVSGNEAIIDLSLKANVNLDATGSIKINLKKLLAVNGKIRSNKGTGNADITIDIENDREIKAESKFVVVPAEKLDLTISLYPDFGKNKNSKIYFSTSNKISQDSLESQNKADILGNPAEFNFKGQLRDDGKTSYTAVEADVTLLNKYAAVKSIVNDQKNGDTYSGNDEFSVEYRPQPGGQSFKLTSTSTWKEANVEDGTGSLNVNVRFDNINGNTVNYDTSLERVVQGANEQITFTNKLHGNALSLPYEFSGNANSVADTGSYQITASAGSENTIKISGDYDVTGDEKVAGSIDIQALSSSKLLKTVKFVSKILVIDPPDGSKNPFVADGYLEMFADDDGTNPGPIINFKGSERYEVGEDSGSFKGSYALNSVDPISLSAAYQTKDNKFSGNADLNYGGDKAVKLSGTIFAPENHISVDANLETPFEGYRVIKLNYDFKISKDQNEIQCTEQISIDGKTYKVESKFVGGYVEPLIDIKYINPSGQKNVVYVKGNIVSEKQFGVEFKIDDKETKFEIDGNVNVNIESIDNFLIKGQVNSAKLKLNKIAFEAQNKPASNDRKIHVLVKSADKNIISGSASYTLKTENGKDIIEGSGSFKIKEESKSGNFKYITQQLETAKNGENGVQVSFDAVLGHWAVDSEYKFTDKHLRLQTSYCEQKKDCASIEIDQKISSTGLEHYSEDLEINIDLRKLGLSHEFGLKSVTSKQGWVISHTVEVHFQNHETHKYKYHFYIEPSQAGFSLSTPKRIIALESKSQIEQKDGQCAKGNGDIGFYLDKKNHPDKRTALTWNFDANLSGLITGDVKFTHPGLRKPLAATIRSTRTGTPYNGKLDIISEFDVFAQENQKIVAKYTQEAKFDKANIRGSATYQASVQSKGLGFDITGDANIAGDKQTKTFSYDGRVNHLFGKSKYENVYSYKLSPTEESALIRILNKDVLKFIIKIQETDKQYVVDSEVSSYDNNPIVSRLSVKNYNTLDYSIGFKRTPNTKITVNAGFIPGQIADLRADYIKEGVKQSLFYATTKLDDADFLKSDYNVDSKAIEAATQRIKSLSENYMTGLEAVGKEWVEESKTESQSLSNLIKKAQPNLAPLRQYYTKELQELKQEILNDKNLKEFSEAITQVLGALISAVSDLIDKLSQITESAVRALQTSFAGVLDVLEKQLIPQVKEILELGLSVTKSILSTTTDIVFTVIGKTAEIIEQYQPQLKALATSVNGLVQDLIQVLHKSFGSAQEFVNNLMSETGLLSELQAEYQKLVSQSFPNAENIVNTVREILHTITEAIPSEFVLKEDIVKLVEALVNYFEKKITSQQVDDAAVLREIAQRLSIIFEKMIESPALVQYSPKKANLEAKLLPKGVLGSLPRLLLARSSVWNYLLSEYLEADVKNLVNLFRNPILIPPFSLFGMVINGQHIFTFDGEQITVSGSCNYLFARDAVNGNFSIAGSYKDGQLISLTIADKTDSFTLLKSGQVKVGASTLDLPIRKPTLAAYRNYEVITLYSTAGAKVTCVPDLSGCAVEVSGFYHGQIRGLLGNGNSEPFDDFTLPSGKVVTSATEFANSYKLNSGCADVTVKSDEVPDNPNCNKLFSSQSSLSSCFLAVPIDNFKAACSRGLTAGIAKTEETIAKAYLATCLNRFVYAELPRSLLKCTNGDKEYSLGDTFSVKLPSKSADVVLVLDTEKDNEPLYKQLLVPLVQDLNKEFNSKGINDVEYHLITYGGLNQWPSHVTAQGKLTFKGKVPSVKFGENPNVEFSVDDINNKEAKSYYTLFQEAWEELSLITGLNLKTRTFDEAYKFPFRVNALKSIVIVNGQACQVGRFYPLQKLFAFIYKNSLVSINLFTPVKSLELKDPKKEKDVVGFNSQAVLTLSQGKKNPKGNAELQKELVYDDYCLDYIVKNRGNVFVNDNFLNNKASQKQFLQIAAVNIVEQLINVEQGLDCECKRINPWNARNVCEEIFINNRPSKKV